MLDSLITCMMMLKLLIKFFVSAQNRGDFRGLADEFNESTNAIRKELNQLTDKGYLVREEGGHKIYYRANKKHPLFNSLQGGIYNFLGIDHLVYQVFERAREIVLAALSGDYAQEVDSGNLEVLIQGGRGDLEKRRLRLKNWLERN